MPRAVSAALVTVVLAVAVAAACSDEPERSATGLISDVTSDVTSDSTSGASSRPTSPPPTVASTAPGETAGTTTGGTSPEGFERVRATVTEPDGTVCELCLWLADTAERRRRGLMFVTDLGPADGMAFLYPRPHTGSFWMKNTPLPLSIAFFDDDGAYLDQFDMEPCIADPCPLHPTPRDFRIAIETTQGDLSELGIVPGSMLELSGLPCDDSA